MADEAKLTTVRPVDVEMYPGFVKMMVPVAEMEMGVRPEYPKLVRAVELTRLMAVPVQ
jgi:hypothetical protein